MKKEPIVIQDQGSFFVGGSIVKGEGTFDPMNPPDCFNPPNPFIPGHPEPPKSGQTLRGDHVYVSYQMPVEPKKYPLVSCKMAEGPNRQGNSRKEILNEIDVSLKRLQLDYVDVYILHRWDWNTPIEETMEALNDVVKSGKARYIGASAMFAWQFEKAYRIAEKNHWANFITMQNHLNLLYREDEREMMPACEDAGVVCTPYSPLASGKLTDPWGTQTNRSLNDLQVQRKYAATENVDRPIVERVEKLAKERGVPMAQIAMAWLLHKSPVQAPILGVTENFMIDDAIAATNLQLSDEEIKYLEELYVPHRVVGAVTKAGTMY